MRVKLEKRGVLGADQVKKGVFTAAHTHSEHICEYPPPPPGMTLIAYNKDLVESQNCALFALYTIFSKKTGQYFISRCLPMQRFV